MVNSVDLWAHTSWRMNIHLPSLAEKCRYQDFNPLPWYHIQQPLLGVTLANPFKLLIGFRYLVAKKEGLDRKKNRVSCMNLYGEKSIEVLTGLVHAEWP